MENFVQIGKTIKEQRLALNLTMDYVAKEAGITRATLSSLENGTLKCSLGNLLSVLNVLNLEFEIKARSRNLPIRSRATRTNTLYHKMVNRFIIMCVEQYAQSINEKSDQVYEEMSNHGVINELTNDYEDLHGMSKEELNVYISALLSVDKTNLYPLNTFLKTDNSLLKSLIISDVTEFVANKYKISVSEARNQFYQSQTLQVLEDESSGLYGYSSLFVFSLYVKEIEQNRKNKNARTI